MVESTKYSINFANKASFMSKINARNTHRTLAYFYVGLIISFAISGIFLNHRRDFSPSSYVSSVKEISILPIASDSVNDAFVENLKKENGIKDKLRRYRIEKEILKISFEQNDVEIDLTTGKGTIETYKTRPLIGQMTQLHQDTSNWWIYYSDLFGLSMAIIAITGMFIQKGKNSFKKRGWILALIGIIFPLIFLLFLG
jgi:uncharacterized protein